MSFLSPLFLFALFAVAIPVIIHLFNFRRFKTVYFSNVEFLKNIQLETKAKSQLKHLLVMFLRMITIAALVFAFAQPFIPGNETMPGSGLNAVGIYIDNSFSMEAESNTGNMLNSAKTKALSIAGMYPAGTKFLLSTNDFEQKHQHLVSKEQLAEFISSIEISPVSRTISEVVSRQSDFFKTAENEPMKGSMFILSDFQKQFFDVENLKPDTNLKVALMPIEVQPLNNLYIDSVWFDTPFRKFNQAEELFVRIVNKSEDAYSNIPVKLFINDSLRAINSLNINAGSEETIALKYTNSSKGSYKCFVEVSDYPVVYDNTFFLNYTIADSLNVLSINSESESRYIKALFKDDKYFNISNTYIKTVQVSSFSGFNVIILNEPKSLSSGIMQELHSFTKNGGTLVFVPAEKGDIASYNEMFSLFGLNSFTGIDTARTKIDYINYNHFIFKNVFQKTDDMADLPVITRKFRKTDISGSTDETILKTIDNNTVLSELEIAKGRVYVFSVPFSNETSNFSKHALFVPVWYNIVGNSISNDRYYNVLGNENTIEVSSKSISGSDVVFHVTGSKYKTDFIPRQSISNFGAKLFIAGELNKAGVYDISYNNKNYAVASFNYNRKESELLYYNYSEIKDKISDLKQNNIRVLEWDSNIESSKSGLVEGNKPLWMLFIVLALLAIAAEIAVIRFVK